MCYKLCYKFYSFIIYHVLLLQMLKSQYGTHSVILLCLLAGNITVFLIAPFILHLFSVWQLQKVADDFHMTLAVFVCRFVIVI